MLREVHGVRVVGAKVLRCCYGCLRPSCRFLSQKGKLTMNTDSFKNDGHFFVEFSGHATCLICQERIAVLKEYNLKRHYCTKHGEQYEKYQGEERKQCPTQLQRGLLSQQSLFHKSKKEADAAVEASYVVKLLIARTGKPFTEGQFLKECMLQVADILCPEKKSLFNNISLLANTVAERISSLSRDIYDQLCDRAKRFTAYFVALDESTDKTDTAQLSIFIRGINDQFEVTEELMSLCAMHGRSTAKDIFQQLSDAIERAGLPWNRLVGITTDGAPSMTGKKKRTRHSIQW
ncbi:general transcription factor II-I repeat domain-containing protein 2-like [Labrus mixtus]|uniref:general transcription factor II-I repeat domain-containing protein 2-like n=1 Tax=Labrus mixtus TaxID=508554 RepID=UPI0029C0626E|nr:general transcription factor II-I repeat domain-containing protein 2-like [Labrus mixtus]